MQSTRRLLISNLGSICKNTNARNNVTSHAASLNVDDSSIRPWNEIPGPSSLPIIGQLHHALPGGVLSDFRLMQERLHKKHGPIVRLDGSFGKPPTLFLYDVDACAYILGCENQNPLRPGFESIEYYRKKHNKTFEPDQLTGLLTDHGDKWKTFRRAVNPTMLKIDKIVQYRTPLQEVAKDMVKRMKKIVQEKSHIITEKFDQEMNLWALESIGVVALGGRLNCLSQHLAEDSPEKRLIQCVHDTFNVANELDFKPSLWKFFPTKKFKRAMKLYGEQEELARHFVQKARLELKNKKPKDDKEKGVLEKLLEIDERIAVIMVSDMLFAGVDTAANTMTGTLYLLATHQDKQDKLREAIASGDEKYVKYCLKESLRMMPVVGGNMRQTTRDYNVLGYKIPAGTFVIFVHQYLSLLEEHFPRPNEFIPERWIDDPTNPISYRHTKKTNVYACQPFGYGVRMCIGRRIAELEITTFLTEVIRNFRVEWTGPPPEIMASSLNYIKGPFNFTFKEI